MASRWGALRQLGSGRWQASYMVNGERFAAPHTFTGKEAAERWLRGVRTDIERGTWRNPREVAAEAAREALRAEGERFGIYAQTWVVQRVSSKGQPLRPKTRAEYERQLRAGLARFHDDRISDITPARVRNWHAERMQAGPSTAGADARLLRAILNTAVVDGIITANPVPSSLTRTLTGQKHRPPTPDELAVLIAEMPDHLRLAVQLAAYGGLRLSEWRALRRRDIAFEGGRALVSVTRTAQYLPGPGWVVGPPKSEEGTRIVPLPTWLTADLEAHLDAHVGRFADSLLFAPERGAAFIHDRYFNVPWDRARVAAGVRVQVGGAWVSEVREHDLRAFAGTLHAQSGATLRETMRLLGHSTTTAAMAYQHAAVDRMAELADRMPPPPVAAKRVQRI